MSQLQLWRGFLAFAQHIVESDMRELVHPGETMMHLRLLYNSVVDAGPPTGYHWQGVQDDVIALMEEYKNLLNALGNYRHQLGCKENKIGNFTSKQYDEFVKKSYDRCWKSQNKALDSFHKFETLVLWLEKQDKPENELVPHVENQQVKPGTTDEKMMTFIERSGPKVRSLLMYLWDGGKRSVRDIPTVMKLLGVCFSCTAGC